MRQLVHWVTLTPSPQRHSMIVNTEVYRQRVFKVCFPLLLVVPGTVLC